MLRGIRGEGARIGATQYLPEGRWVGKTDHIAPYGAP